MNSIQNTFKSLYKQIKELTNYVRKEVETIKREVSSRSRRKMIEDIEKKLNKFDKIINICKGILLNIKKDPSSFNHKIRFLIPKLKFNISYLNIVIDKLNVGKISKYQIMLDEKILSKISSFLTQQEKISFQTVIPTSNYYTTTDLDHTLRLTNEQIHLLIEKYKKIFPRAYVFNFTRDEINDLETLLYNIQFTLNDIIEDFDALHGMSPHKLRIKKTDPQVINWIYHNKILNDVFIDHELHNFYNHHLALHYGLQLDNDVLDNIPDSPLSAWTTNDQDTDYDPRQLYMDDFYDSYYDN
jgi:hypothetical protein